MKRYIYSIVFILFLTTSSYSQGKAVISAKVSPNEIGMQYERYLLADELWTGIYTGIGNQDINSRFDDFILGVNGGYKIMSGKSAGIALTAGFGLYSPRNGYYNANTLFGEGGVSYSYYPGKSRRHSLIVNLGYRYGRRTITQTSSNELFNVSSTDYFRISPLHISVGWGIKL